MQRRGLHRLAQAGRPQPAAPPPLLTWTTPFRASSVNRASCHHPCCSPVCSKRVFELVIASLRLGSARRLDASSNDPVTCQYSSEQGAGPRRAPGRRLLCPSPARAAPSRCAMQILAIEQRLDGSSALQPSPAPLSRAAAAAAAGLPPSPFVPRCRRARALPSSRR